MTRVKVGLNGFSQVPDEHGGAPRVTRLVNARLEVPERIGKSPGTVALPVIINAGAQSLIAPLAYAIAPSGTSIVIDRKERAGITGATVHALEGVAWQYQSQESNAEIEIEEAPRTDLIFGDASYNYRRPGIMDLGDGDFVVFADAFRMDQAAGAVTYASELHWALVSGADLLVKARGTVPDEAPNTTGGPRYPTVAGKYLCAWYRNTGTIAIYEFSRPGCALNVIATFSFISAPYAYGAQFDVSHDSVRNRLLIVCHNGEYHLIDTVTYQTVHTGTIPGLTPTPTIGSLGASMIYAGSPSESLLYVAWRGSATQWYRAIYTIDDTAVTVSVAAAVIHTSATTLVSSDAPFQALVTAWYDTDYATDGGALVVVTDVPYGTGSPSTQGVLLHLLPNGALMSRGTSGFDFFGAFPAAKPVIVPTVTGTGTSDALARCWAYMNSGRDLRSAVCLAQSERSYTCAVSSGVKVYPRIVGMALRAGDPAPAPTEYYVGGSNPTIRTSTGIRGRSGWLCALLARRDAATVATHRVYLVSQGDGSALLSAGGTTLPDVLQSAAAHGATMLAGAVPSQFGSRAEMAGSQYSPRKPIATANGASGSIPAGTYVYCAVRKWFDSSGNVNRSSVSEPYSVTSSAAGSFDIRVTDDPWENRQVTNDASPSVTNRIHGTVTEIYRTANAGSVFYLVTPEGLPTPGSQLLGELFNDSTLDATLISKEILYTQGSTGGNSGTLDWWGCPPCRCIWAGSNRVIVGGLENSRRAHLSNLFYPGEGVSFPQDAAFWVEIPEDVTAVASLDQAWLVFSETGIYAFNGAGPDSFGSGTFGDPVSLPSGVGARSWRSLVETAEGIWFQATNARIYCVQRGSLQVVEKSQGIRDSVGCYPTSVNGYTAGDGDTSPPTYWVIGATYDALTDEIWFVDNSTRSWVYQCDLGAWREEVCTGDSERVRIHAGSIRVGTYEGPAIIARPSASPVGYRCARESDTAYLTDWTSSIRYMGVGTNDIDLVHGRVKKAWIRTRAKPGAGTDRFLAANCHFWFDGLQRDQAPDETRAYALDTSAVTTRFLDEEFVPARQRCNQLRIVWADVPDATRANVANYVLGIELELEQSPKVRGSIRNATGTNRGS